MTSLPDWAIKSYAEGHGSEAQLARMVIALQEELKQAKEITILAGKTNRRLMEVALETQERDARTVASLREVVRVVRGGMGNERATKESMNRV